MIVITGYSHKRDGFCFVAQTDDINEARKQLIAICGSYKIVEHGDLLYLLEIDFSGDPATFEDECPRWEGWSLYVGKTNDNGFANDAVCW
jgi:hypothetical protein